MGFDVVFNRSRGGDDESRQAAQLQNRLSLTREGGMLADGSSGLIYMVWHSKKLVELAISAPEDLIPAHITADNLATTRRLLDLLGWTFVDKRPPREPVKEAAP